MLSSYEVTPLDFVVFHLGRLFLHLARLKYCRIKDAHTEYGGGSQKILIHMRFTHIDVNFDVKYEGHQNCSRTLSINILRLFGHHHMRCQN